MNFTENICNFMHLVETGKVEIYNEFSFQHELGFFLRSQFPTYRVEFERNVSYFNFEKQRFVKKEIDISLVDRSTQQHLGVIELKYPRNGQVPEQMYSFCKDILFIEQLIQAGFKAGIFVAVVDDHLFYSGKSEGIYSMFRGGAPIHGQIRKPTGVKDSKIEIRGTYYADWQKIHGKTKWFIVEVSSQLISAAYQES